MSGQSTDVIRPAQVASEDTARKSNAVAASSVGGTQGSDSRKTVPRKPFIVKKPWFPSGIIKSKFQVKPGTFTPVNATNINQVNLQKREVPTSATLCTCPGIYLLLLRNGQIPTLAMFNFNERDLRLYLTKVLSCEGHSRPYKAKYKDLLHAMEKSVDDDIDSFLREATDFLAKPSANESAETQTMREQLCISPPAFYGNQLKSRKDLHAIDYSQKNSSENKENRPPSGSGRVAFRKPALPSVYKPISGGVLTEKTSNLKSEVEIVDLTTLNPTETSAAEDSGSIASPSPSARRKRHATVEPIAFRKRKAEDQYSQQGANKKPFNTQKSTTTTIPHNLRHQILARISNTQSQMAEVTRLLGLTNMQTNDNEEVQQSNSSTVLRGSIRDRSERNSPTNRGRQPEGIVVAVRPPMLKRPNTIDYNHDATDGAQQNAENEERPARSSGQQATSNRLDAAGATRNQEATTGPVHAGTQVPRKVKKKALTAERKLTKPELPATIPPQGSKTDAELIEIGKLINHYDRHSRAPYAYRWHGQLRASYHYLLDEMGKNDLPAWTKEEVTRIIR